jgi:hypothetical protein
VTAGHANALPSLGRLPGSVRRYLQRALPADAAVPSQVRITHGGATCGRGRAAADEPKLEFDSDQGFAEPVALSSTQPADRALPRRALRLSLNLVALRARRTRDLSHRAATVKWLLSPFAARHDGARKPRTRSRPEPPGLDLLSVEKRSCSRLFRQHTFSSCRDVVVRSD